MPDSVPGMLHRDIQLYCPRLRAYHCGTWDLVTIFVDDLPHYIKKTSYRLIDDDVINMQTSLQIHIQLYPTIPWFVAPKHWYFGLFHTDDD